MTGTLYIIATPIGNLADITLRALDILKSVDFILCEDTRVTKKLLDYYEIKKELISYHQHSSGRKTKEIKDFLASGKKLALVTDAGTPGISDPGGMLIQSIVNTLDNIEIVPIPGASAVISALSISGIPTDKFIFMGFPPHKNKRQKFFKEVASANYTVCFYESNHRIKKCLSELKDVLSKNQKIVVCRELTKKFETIYRGSIEEVLQNMKSEKGEFVVIIDK